MRSGLGVTRPACGSAVGGLCTAAIAGSDERQALSIAHPIRVWRDTLSLPPNVDLVMMTPDCLMLYTSGRRQYIGRLEKTGVLREWAPYGCDGRPLAHRATEAPELLARHVFRAYVEMTKAAS